MSKNVGSRFSCSICGLCCQHIDQISDLREFDRGDGICKYLNGTQCSIYECRPEVCRVDDMYDKYFYLLYQSRKEYYYENKRICDSLQKTAVLNHISCIKKP